MAEASGDCRSFFEYETRQVQRPLLQPQAGGGDDQHADHGCSSVADRRCRSGHALARLVDGLRKTYDWIESQVEAHACV